MSILTGGTHCWVSGGEVLVPVTSGNTFHTLEMGFLLHEYLCSFHGLLQVWWSNHNVIIMWPGICIFWITLTFERDWSSVSKHLLSGRVVQPDFYKRWEASELAISQPFDVPGFQLFTPSLAIKSTPYALNNVSDTIKDLKKKEGLCSGMVRVDSFHHAKWKEIERWNMSCKVTRPIFQLNH